MNVSDLLSERCSHKAAQAATRSRRRANLYVFSITNIMT
jgi:hypothetical protein